MRNTSRALPRPAAGPGRKAASSLAFAFAACLLAPRPAAALVPPLTFAEMAARSKLVVHGEVIDVRCYRAPFLSLGEVIFTDVTIRVRGALKGAPGGNEVTVQLLGGEMGTEFQRCLESPRFEKGEKVLVFLREYSGALWTTGWHQGKYKLDATGTVVKGDAKLPIDRDVPLAAVKAEVERLAASAPAPTAPARTLEEGGAK